MDKQKIISWILGGSMAILALVMLITSSIYMHFYDQDASVAPQATKTVKTYTIVSLILVLFGIISLFVGGYFFYKNAELTKVAFLWMVLALVIFVISFAIIGTDQREAFNAYGNIPQVFVKSLPASMVNAMRMFPVNLSFILLMGVPFIGASIFYVKDEFLL